VWGLQYRPDLGLRLRIAGLVVAILGVILWVVDDNLVVLAIGVLIVGLALAIVGRSWGAVQPRLSPRGRRVNVLPRPPKHLSAPARRLWRDTVEGYELERHHLELLERACRALDQAIDAEEILRRDGLVVDGRYGPRAHPAVAIARDART
jgi:hypothetical protein